MGTTNRKVLREVFWAVPETCPFVDAALSDILDSFDTHETRNAIECAITRAESMIKEQTGKLREALTEWVGRAMDAEEEIEHLRSQIGNLRHEIEGLEADIEELQEAKSK